MAVIQSVNKGDIIIERINGRKKMTPVRTVEVNACSKPSVHINGNECYDWGTYVDVAYGDETLGDLAEKVEEVDQDADPEWGLDRLDAMADRLVKH